MSSTPSSTPSDPNSESTSTESAISRAEPLTEERAATANNRVSVLITVYDRVHPSDFALALRSIYEQTRAPDEVVIVEDGPLTPELIQVSEMGSRLLASRCRVGAISLEANVGSGPASDEGLQAITSGWIARLDADDVARPERLAQQMAFVADKKSGATATRRSPHTCIDLLSTSMVEFNDQALTKKPWREVLDNPIDWAALDAATDGVRRLPTSHRVMAKYLRVNSPINTPAALLRTELVRCVGGYGNHPFVEDYDLYARMVADGGIMAGLDEPLTYFRSSPSVLDRRRDRRIHRSEWQLQQRLVRYGLISPWRARANFVLRTAYRMLPTQALKRVYGALFHR